MLPLLALLAPLSGGAQTVVKPQDAGAWTMQGDRAMLAVAHVSVPDRAAGLALTSTGEASHPGTRLDNVAKYEAPNGKVFATAYVYRPTYADAALAAYATERAVRSRFGAGVALETGVVPFAGEPRGAIRQIYRGGRLDGRPLTTAAAFARVGPWLMKLRATGPADRDHQVTRALDALVAGVRVTTGAQVPPAAPLAFAAPCPAPAGRKAKLLRQKDNATVALIGGLMGGGILSAPPGDHQARVASLGAFPGNGTQPVCVRGTMMSGDAARDLLFPAQTGTGAVMLLTLDDAGGVLAVEPLAFVPGYTIKRYGIGEVQVAGTLDGYPTADQLASWMRARNPPELAIRGVTRVAADGSSKTEINAAALE